MIKKWTATLSIHFRHHKEIRHVPEIGLDNGDRVVVDSNTIGRSRTHAQCGFFSYVGALTPKIDL